MRSGTRRIAVGFSAVVLVGAMVFFAIQLADSQSESRAEIEQRFHERPEITASLTESLFAATTATGGRELSNQFGGREVSAQALTEVAEQDNSVFSAVFDDQGKMIAVSEDTSPAVREELTSNPAYVQAVLSGQPFAISRLLDLGEGGGATTAFAQGFESDFGKRVLVNGFPPVLLSTFLGQVLNEVPNVTGGESFLLGPTGRVVASSTGSAAPGDQVDMPGLTEALAGGDQGSFGGGEFYFAASPVENTPWKVVSTAPEDQLFESISGLSKWTPWLVFAAFSFAGITALIMFRRLAAGAAELEKARTSLERSNRELKRRAKELELSNAELDQFASIASHDLQEPLRKVQMFAEKVADSEAERLSDRGREYLQRSSDAAGRMQVLIQDLLEFSRVATRARPPVETDLGELTDEVISDLQGTIGDTKARVEVGEMPTLPVDRTQIRQLLQNLVSNAIKFHRSGIPPEVRIEGEMNGNMATVRVSDNGIGFEQEHAGRIFRVFERLHGRGQYPGTGIGLALSRKIAERHGGTVTAQSVPGEGSTFTVTLSAEADDDLDPRTFRESHGGPGA